jgi:hypothetical protein
MVDSATCLAWLTQDKIFPSDRIGYHKETLLILYAYNRIYLQKNISQSTKIGWKNESTVYFLFLFFFIFNKKLTFFLLNPLDSKPLVIVPSLRNTIGTIQMLIGHMYFNRFSNKSFFIESNVMPFDSPLLKLVSPSLW